jgi:hypothetical protein
MPGIAGAKPPRCLPGDRAGRFGRVKISISPPCRFRPARPIRHAQLFHPTGVLANGTIERIAATGEGVAVDRLLLAARLAAAGVDLSGRLPEFFLVDFVPLLSRADYVVSIAMNMCPFLPNCVDVTRWRRPHW